MSPGISSITLGRLGEKDNIEDVPVSMETEETSKSKKQKKQSPKVVKF